MVNSVHIWPLRDPGINSRPFKCTVFVRLVLPLIWVVKIIITRFVLCFSFQGEDKKCQVWNKLSLWRNNKSIQLLKCQHIFSNHHKIHKLFTLVWLNINISHSNSSRWVSFKRWKCDISGFPLACIPMYRIATLSSFGFI